MRWIAAATTALGLLGLTACTTDPSNPDTTLLCRGYLAPLGGSRGDPAILAELNRRNVDHCVYGVGPVYRRSPSAVVTPTPPSPAQARENTLLEDALSGRPDYTAALRRAAEANISEENPIRRESRAQREARIDAEVARLSDAVEARRRQRLAQQQQQQRSSQDQAALDACQARGAQIEASMFDRRSILNLEAAATGAQVRDACIQNYLRSR